MSSKEDIKKRWFTDARPVSSSYPVNLNINNRTTSKTSNFNSSNQFSSTVISKHEEFNKNSSQTNNSIVSKSAFSAFASSSTSTSKQQSSLTSSSINNNSTKWNASNLRPSTMAVNTLNNTIGQPNNKYQSSSTYISPYRGVTAGPIGTYLKAHSAETLTSNPLKTVVPYRKSSEASPILKPLSTALLTSAALSKLNATKSIFDAKPIYSLQNVTPISQVNTWTVSQQNSANLSSAKKKLKGYAIIFNHEKFKEKKMNREGSRRDEEALSRIFQRFDFSTSVKRNLTFQEIQSEVKNLTKKNFKDNGCFVGVILSHGTNDETIFAYDRPFNLNRHFIHPIAANTTLIGKPKIFIIATCRGDMENLFVSYAKVETDSVPFSEQSLSVPCYRDILKCYSTYEGFVSYRNPSKGTIYIQTLCNVLEKKGATNSIEDVLKEVNREITEGVSLNKQVPTVVSTMSTNFCFGDLKPK